MKKKPALKTYLCRSCGVVLPRWYGKCPSCESWNTIEEYQESASRFSENRSFAKGSPQYEAPLPIHQIGEERFQRTSTGFSELDLVLGGGIVPGSLILIGGEPGIGKSTLILEVARNLSHSATVLYVSGEESASQIGLRARRLGISNPNILLSSETFVENIAEMVSEIRPSFVFIDSIQTVQKKSLLNQAGSITQLRESAQSFLEIAKAFSIPIFLIGHITKEGLIAGPKALEHIVDTVLYFEGDKLNYFRIIRAVKNRFGAVGDLAFFEMKNTGLEEVNDKKSLFLLREEERAEGSVLSVVMEGSRAISVEVQALVAKSSLSNTRRISEGLDNKRLVLLCAVIEKYLEIPLSQMDVFANLAGGLTIDEPALDLAISMAILSSARNSPVSHKTGFLGEVGLSGEVRNVGQLGLRLKELEGVGAGKVILPWSGYMEYRNEFPSIEVLGIRHIRDLERHLHD